MACTARRAETSRRSCASNKAAAACCSARSSRARKPRPTRCRATWARARRAGPPTRSTGCCTWRRRGRASVCIWWAICRWTRPAARSRRRRRPACWAACGPALPPRSRRRWKAKPRPRPPTAPSGRANPCGAWTARAWRSCRAWPTRWPAPALPPRRAASGARAANIRRGSWKPATTRPSAPWRMPGWPASDRTAWTRGRPGSWPNACPRCAAN
ncbi:hypothetical protein D9M72_237610 [compost metagenome]